MRYLETPPIGGGTALNNSFMLSTGVGGKDTKPRATFAHEMIHMWVGGIEGPDGVTSWFSEGLTTYYTALLPARGGFFTPEEQAAQITAIAKGYWAAPARNWSAAKIAEAGFTDEITRHVPYNRSALYFADLDAKIYAKSKGERRLIDMLQPMFEYRNKGSKFTQAAWVAMLTLELGPEAEKQFKNVIIDGKDITPVADAFGPCFERRERVYDADKESVVGYEWVRKRGVEEDTCREW
jgi:predicted metalloprotease with PDZ domain